MASDGLTNKELLQEVRLDNKKALETQASILTTLQGIDNHLGLLNSKVATHEKAIGELRAGQTELKTEHLKVKTVWATLATIAGIIWAGFEFFWK